MGKKKESSFYRSTGVEKNRTECLQSLTRPPLLTSTSRRPEERLVLPPLSLQRLVPSVFPQRRSETRSPPRPEGLVGTQGDRAARRAEPSGDRFCHPKRRFLGHQSSQGALEGQKEGEGHQARRQPRPRRRLRDR